MLISPAFAQEASAPDAFVGFLPLILIFVVFWFLLIRPQQKRMREHREMVQALKKGDQVVTGGGIMGKVYKVEDDTTLIVEIAPEVRVKVARGTITDNITPTPGNKTPNAANDDGGAKKSFLGKIFGR